MNSRERILGRVRRALTDVPPGEDTPVERDYLREHGKRTAEETVDLLADNLADYRAVVHRTDSEELPYVIMRLLAERGPQYVLVPPGLPPEWMSAADPTRVHDRAVSTARELDKVESVVTGCAVAIAETGTIVLDGSPTRAGAGSAWSPTTTSAWSASRTRWSRPSRRPWNASTPPAR